jgi:fructose-specific phosphotransferase system IIC component
LLQHPQLWFIPVALSILVATHLNRQRLDAAQTAMFRYLSMALIYLSSTTEIFLTGVAEAPWLPLVLAGLSVAGVLTGIMLRIRSFLLLGSVFLLISLLTMIWHASANLGWTWLWYVAGIALGVMIIGLFALFEKRRTQMLQLIEGLKEWQA